MRRWLLAIAVVALGITVGSLFYRDHSRAKSLEEYADSMLGNFREEWLSAMKRRLSDRARELGIALPTESIRIERRASDRKSAAAGLAAKMKIPIAVQSVEVSIAAAYESSVLGFRRRHAFRVSRVI